MKGWVGDEKRKMALFLFFQVLGEFQGVGRGLDELQSNLDFAGCTHDFLTKFEKQNGPIQAGPKCPPTLLTRPNRAIRPVFPPVSTCRHRYSSGHTPSRVEICTKYQACNKCKMVYDIGDSSRLLLSNISFWLLPAGGRSIFEIRPCHGNRAPFFSLLLFVSLCHFSFFIFSFSSAAFGSNKVALTDIIFGST